MKTMKKTPIRDYNSTKREMLEKAKKGRDSELDDEDTQGKKPKEN